MGTNYYYEDENETQWHIGKSSWGWEFSWRAQPELDVYSVRQWYAFLSLKEDEAGHSVIVDEYNDPCSFEEFIKITDKREREIQFGGKLENQYDWVNSNQPDFLSGYYKDCQGASFSFHYFC